MYRIILPSLLMLLTASAFASSDAQELAKQIWERPDGDFVTRQLELQLIDTNGKVRSREATVHRGLWEGVKKTRIQFTAPRRVNNTGFLTYDYHDADQTDEQWMYLPALRRERRIPASDRGDNFMGSEFSYEDIKSELKFPLQDYDFKLSEAKGSNPTLRGTPKTQTLSDELGYGKFEALIDLETLLPLSITFWDTQMRPLKTVRVLASEQVNGFWQATDIKVENTQSGHASRFIYSDIQYKESMNNSEFVVSAIRK